MFIHVETVTIKCKNSKPNIIVIVGLGCNQNYQDDVHTVVDYSPYALDLLEQGIVVLVQIQLGT